MRWFQITRQHDSMYGREPQTAAEESSHNIVKSWHMYAALALMRSYALSSQALDVKRESSS